VRFYFSLLNFWLYFRGGLDCEQRLQSSGLCAALDAELVVVEAKVAACVAANKLRDDHYNAAGYVPNLQKDAMVDAQHSVQRDIQKNVDNVAAITCLRCRRQAMRSLYTNKLALACLVWMCVYNPNSVRPSTLGRLSPPLNWRKCRRRDVAPKTRENTH